MKSGPCGPVQPPHPHPLPAGLCPPQPRLTGLPMVPTTCQGPVCLSNFRLVVLGQEKQESKRGKTKEHSSVLPHLVSSFLSSRLGLNVSFSGRPFKYPIQGRTAPPTAVCLRTLIIPISASITSDCYFVCLKAYLLFTIRYLCVVGSLARI